MSQESSDKSCSCCSQCPPWWVTMGFVPPLQIPQANGASGQTPVANPTPAAPTPATPTPGANPGGVPPRGNNNPLGVLGTILGDVAGVLGGI